MCFHLKTFKNNVGRPKVDKSMCNYLKNSRVDLQKNNTLYPESIHQQNNSPFSLP